MSAHRLFQAIVVHGSVLGLAGCPDKPVEALPADGTPAVTDPAADPADLGGERGAEPVCEGTDAWANCSADGVQCCWAAGAGCEPCCGHLAP